MDEPEEKLEGKPDDADAEPEISLVVTASIDTDGQFLFHIDPGTSPIMLAGIAWYLESMATLGLSNLLTAQAQARAAREAKTPKLFAPKDHLRKRN